MTEIKNILFQYSKKNSTRCGSPALEKAKNSLECERPPFSAQNSLDSSRHRKVSEVVELENLSVRTQDYVPEG